MLTPFLLKGLSLVNGLSNLSSTVDGISSRLDILSDQVSSLHKQVNFEHDSQTVEIDLDPNSVGNHLWDLVHNWNSRKTQLYFESESLLKVLESMIMDNYSGSALSHVLGRAREFLTASSSSWSFVRKSSNAARLQSFAFPVNCHARVWACSMDHLILDVSVFCDFQDLNSTQTFSPDQEWLQMADSACDGRWIYLVSMLFLMFGFSVELFQNFRNTFALFSCQKSGKIGPQKSVEGHLSFCLLLVAEP